MNADKDCSSVKSQADTAKSPIQATSRSEGEKVKHNPFIIEGIHAFKAESMKVVSINHGATAKNAYSSKSPRKQVNAIDSCKKIVGATSTTTNAISEPVSMGKSQVAPAKSPKKIAGIQKSGEVKHNPFIVKGHGNWETTSSRKSPAKIAPPNKEDNIKARSIDIPIKVNNTSNVHTSKDEDRVTIEYCEEDNEEFYDVKVAIIGITAGGIGISKKCYLPGAAYNFIGYASCFLI
ncbi:hypothetical protein C5167_031808 [Papaver somniferum]|uniref:Uncharacterized protein n=1 Tax=Papaver somniferum TaxID=3469 RepID=A0A4Y7K739_PAPSO|nr:hypothetical protein C5167_031808 [Papaver somniferum]